MMSDLYRSPDTRPVKRRRDGDERAARADQNGFDGGDVRGGAALCAHGCRRQSAQPGFAGADVLLQSSAARDRIH